MVAETPIIVVMPSRLVVRQCETIDVFGFIAVYLSALPVWLAAFDPPLGGTLRIACHGAFCRSACGTYSGSFFSAWIGWNRVSR